MQPITEIQNFQQLKNYGQLKSTVISCHLECSDWTRQTTCLVGVKFNFFVFKTKTDFDFCLEKSI